MIHTQAVGIGSKDRHAVVFRIYRNGNKPHGGVVLFKGLIEQVHILAQLRANGLAMGEKEIYNQNLSLQVAVEPHRIAGLCYESNVGRSMPGGIVAPDAISQHTIYPVCSIIRWQLDVAVVALHLKEEIGTKRYEQAKKPAKYETTDTLCTGHGSKNRGKWCRFGLQSYRLS